MERRPANERHFERLDRPAARYQPLPDGRQRDPYLQSGSHPDCVERVWNDLGDTLPEDCKFLLLGRAVLAHPRSGFVFGMPFGTRYALWIPEPHHALAAAAGLLPTATWSGGTNTDLSGELGVGWLFGGWKAGEVDWLRAAYVEAAIDRNLVR